MSGFNRDWFPEYQRARLCAEQATGKNKAQSKVYWSAIDKRSPRPSDNTAAAVSDHRRLVPEFTIQSRRRKRGRAWS